LYAALNGSELFYTEELANFRRELALIIDVVLLAFINITLNIIYFTFCLRSLHVKVIALDDFL
jgi:hypothetical protein